MDEQLEARLKKLQSFEPDVSEGILPATDYACNTVRILFRGLHLNTEYTGLFPNTEYPGGIFIESSGYSLEAVMIDIFPNEDPDKGNGLIFAFKVDV